MYNKRPSYLEKQSYQSYLFLFNIAYKDTDFSGIFSFFHLFSNIISDKLTKKIYFKTYFFNKKSVQSEQRIVKVRIFAAF